MQVTTITVSRSRKVAPEQYGNSEIGIVVAANLEANEDWQAATNVLIADLTTLVYTNLGLKVPGKVQAVATALTPVTGETVTTTQTSAVETPVAGDKPRRGRPPKDKAATVGDIPDDKPATASDAPGTDTVERNITANPENRVNPDDDIPGNTPAPAAVVQQTATVATPATSGPFTASDLQSYLTKLVKDRKITAHKVREVLASHGGVARTVDLTADKVLVVKSAIDANIAAT